MRNPGILVRTSITNYVWKFPDGTERLYSTPYIGNNGTGRYVPLTGIEDAAGNQDLEELAPIETTLPAEHCEPGKLVPVNLQAAVTEIGTLELRCLEKNGNGRWKLELNVRMKGQE